MRWFLRSYELGGSPVSINDLWDTVSPASRALIDQWLGIDSVDLLSSEMPALRVEALRRFLLTQTSPTLFKVHEAARCPQNGVLLLPEGIHHRVLLLVRDPRDVALSYAHFARVTVDTSVDWLCDSDHCIPLYQGGPMHELPVHLGSWSDHLNGWLTLGATVRTIRYEDLCESPAASFGAALDHLDLQVEPIRLQRAIASTQFHAAQQEERRIGFGEAMPGVAFFREGTHGSWRWQLAPRLAKRLEKAHGTLMRRFGYL